jgi:hypothetical protein
MTTTFSVLVIPPFKPGQATVASGEPLRYAVAPLLADSTCVWVYAAARAGLRRRSIAWAASVITTRARALGPGILFPAGAVQGAVT